MDSSHIFMQRRLTLTLAINQMDASKQNAEVRPKVEDVMSEYRTIIFSDEVLKDFIQVCLVRSCEITGTYVCTEFGTPNNLHIVQHVNGCDSLNL